ncbi:MAG: hypothetical protein ND866_06775 [Pyrinomonadaceae bacterium]|nr:hypothetical protein [Pyrinomonadaceae bacterium]
MKSSLAALVIWALFFSGNCYRSAKVQGPETLDPGQEKMAPITLTKERAVNSFPVTPQTLAAAPQILEVSVTKVVNPEKLPVAIYVSLSPAGEKAVPELEKIPLGNFSLYPPDRPGKFLLQATAAFDKLKGAVAPKANEVRLVLEMKSLDAKESSAPVEVTLAPPQWRTDEPK